MANTIQLKYSNTASNVPTLAEGEIAINQADKKLYFRNSAGTILSKSLEVENRTDVIYNGTTALTPKFAMITASASGNTAVVAAVTGKKIRVLSYSFMANGIVNVKFQSATTDITGLSYLVANTGKIAPLNPYGHFETASGVALNINLSAAIAVGGELTYIEI